MSRLKWEAKILDIFKLFWLALATALLISVAPSYGGILNSTTLINAAHNEDHLGGGNVLSAHAQPHGYSLADMAKLTSNFNETDHSGPFPDVVNGKPFQGLFSTAINTFDVNVGTMLYVPILFNDDSPPVIGNFPKAAILIMTPIAYNGRPILHVTNL